MTFPGNNEMDDSSGTDFPYIDLDQIIKDFSSQTQEATRQIHPRLLLPPPKIAFHASDADGLVCAAILKTSGVEEFQSKNSIYIPLNYQQIKHPQYGRFLTQVKWVAVVDLPPIHSQNSGALLYCDHHMTNKELPKTAQLVLFNAGAPSAAKLLADYYHDVLPSHIKKLAELTTITDTANYRIEPPTDVSQEIPSSLSSQAWLIHDLCESTETPHEILKLVDGLVEEGLTPGLYELYSGELRKVREKRVETLKIVDGIDLAEVVMFILGKQKVSTTSLVQSLFSKGVKLTCLFYPGKAFTGLSFRVNSQIPESEIEKIRVDQVAQQFSGGGHPRAAGGRSPSLTHALKKVKRWVTQMELSYEIYDLRNESAQK